ncbi:hypothetical protein AB1Y20_007113 [Prymnesium parvum]|uniref:Uncharacterized protein n=1 Tax=Prymnesium parvum TaxID=97485 RepID=A0AB34J2Q2_PRYPA
MEERCRRSPPAEAGLCALPGAGWCSPLRSAHDRWRESAPSCSAAQQLSLLIALARSPAAFSLTGKSQLHWRRLEHAAWRAAAAPPRDAPPSARARREDARGRAHGRAQPRRRAVRRWARLHAHGEARLHSHEARLHSHGEARLHSHEARLHSHGEARGALRGAVQPRGALRGAVPPQAEGSAGLSARQPNFKCGALELPSGHPLLLFPEELLGFDFYAVDDRAYVPQLEQAPLPAYQQAVLGATCGGFAGMLSRSVIHPLDTLRVLQSVSSQVNSAEAIADAHLPAFERLAAASGHWWRTATRALADGRSILRTATFNWHQLGVESANPFYDTMQLRNSVAILYRGYGVSVFGAQPVFGAYFAAYEVCKLKVAAVMPDEWRGSSVVQLTAGFMAECCAALLWNPWEVVRQRLQLASGGQRTFSGAAMDVISESGVRGLYAGLGAYMALWGAYSPLMFMFYEQGLKLLTSRQQAPHGRQAPPSIAVNFAMGALAGGTAAVITSPLDVVKTRIQCQSPGSIIEYESVWHGLREIMRHEGGRALFHGTLARSLNMGLSTGIMLTCYSTLRNHVGIRLGWIAPPPPPPQRDGGRHRVRAMPSDAGRVHTLANLLSA